MWQTWTMWTLSLTTSKTRIHLVWLAFFRFDGMWLAWRLRFQRDTSETFPVTDSEEAEAGTMRPPPGASPEERWQTVATRMLWGSQPCAPLLLTTNPFWDALSPPFVFIWPRCSDLDESKSWAHGTWSLLVSFDKLDLISLFAFMEDAPRPRLPSDSDLKYLQVATWRPGLLGSWPCIFDWHVGFSVESY